MPDFRIRCPNCHVQIELVPDADLESVHCSICDSHFALASDDPQNSSGASLERIAHFQLLERVGLGAFGSVWRAHDDDLDRTVALKIPRKGAFDDAQQRAFLREAQAAAQLSHPGIVPVYEVGRDGDVLYIVSEFIRGRTLADTIAAGRVPMHEAAEICRQVADALHHAHKQGVIHRDLKPGNIMLRDDGQPRLMDFGLAKRDSTELTVSLDGAVLGTPAYMPPEQATGDSAKADARSDVYSLGVVLYELLTGELPFRGSVRMLLQQVVNDEAPSPRRLNSSVPQDLETITLKCLQKSPKSRYQSAANLRDELERWLAGKDILSRPTSPAEKTLRWCKRNPAPTAAILASCTTCVLLFATVLYQLQLQRFQRIESSVGRIEATGSAGVIVAGGRKKLIAPSRLETPRMRATPAPASIRQHWIPVKTSNSFATLLTRLSPAAEFTPNLNGGFLSADVSDDGSYAYVANLTLIRAYQCRTSSAIWTAGDGNGWPIETIGKLPRPSVCCIATDESTNTLACVGCGLQINDCSYDLAIYWLKAQTGETIGELALPLVPNIRALVWCRRANRLVGVAVREGSIHVYSFNSKSMSISGERHYAFSGHGYPHGGMSDCWKLVDEGDTVGLLCWGMPLNRALPADAMLKVYPTRTASWERVADINATTLDLSCVK